MATSWKSQQGNGEYRLQFETDNEEEYKLVEKAAQMAMDGKTKADFVEVKHGYWVDDIQEFTSPAGVTQKYLCGYKCSLCGRSERIKEPYCNCGAYMDGGNAE